MSVSDTRLERGVLHTLDDVGAFRGLGRSRCARLLSSSYSTCSEVLEHPKPAQFRGKLQLMSDFPEHREPIRDPEVLKRMGVAFDLYQVAEAMKRQNLRRRNPHATEEEIEQGVREWLRHRPGAEHGDGVGRPRPKPLEL